VGWGLGLPKKKGKELSCEPRKERKRSKLRMGGSVDFERTGRFGGEYLANRRGWARIFRGGEDCKENLALDLGGGEGTVSLWVKALKSAELDSNNPKIPTKRGKKRLGKGRGGGEDSLKSNLIFRFGLKGGPGGEMGLL